MKTIVNGNIAPIVVIWFISMIAVETGCEQSAKNRVQSETAQPMKNIDEVIEMHADSLLKISGVVGVYHGLNEDGSSCLKVMVKKKTPEIARRVPKTLEGYSVEIDETGEIKPMK